MQPSVFITFVRARGYLPQLVIDDQPSKPVYPPDQEVALPTEVALSDADAWDIFNAHRLPPDADP
jgi:hypothetical protein